MIRFVEHGDLDITEVAVVLPDEIGQTPRAGNDYVGTVA
jgi:hypothetical protein